MTTPFTQKKDNNDIAIPSTTSFVTVDGASVSSPVAYAGTAVTVTTPTNTIDVSITPTTDMLISEDSTMSSYYLIPANSEKVIGISRMTTFYIKQSASSGSCYFSFNLL